MKSVSILLPIFNEKKSLLHVVSAWHAHMIEHAIPHEFLMCEDGSTDGSKELIVELEKKFPVVNLSTVERRGYGGGVIAGLNGANNEFILCIDSDGQCMPDSFMDLFRLVDNCDVVIGIRSPRKDPLIRKVYSGLFFSLFQFLFFSQIKDPSCPYILARKEVYIRLMPKLSYMREGFWWGFIGAAIKEKLKILQVPIVHYERYDGSTVVYKPSKMPAIILRNIKGLFLLRFS